MAKLAVRRPLDEGDLHDDLGTYPVRSNERQADSFGERRFRNLESVEPGAEIQQQLRIEACADLPGKNEVVPLEVAYKQRPQADPPALGISEAANHELLRRLAFHL